MKTESTLYFDGQFWVGVIERHEADRVRAVRIVFGAQPSDAEFYEFLLAHANALLCRLDEAAWTPDMGLFAFWRVGGGVGMGSGPAR